jgi:phosphatidylinositol glycan class W
MDLGVGSFVFSQGIVSAIPLVRDPAYITAPMFPKLFSVMKHSLPVIVLGVVRVLLVKGTEYPEHVTEYGVHWNFFITLALLPILQVCLHPLIRFLPVSVSAVGFLVGLGKPSSCISSLQMLITGSPTDSSLSFPPTRLCFHGSAKLVD